MSKIVFLKNLQTLLTPLKRLIDRKAENVNWNENDPSASGYIANRPFYTYEKIIEGKYLVEETTFTNGANGIPLTKNETLLEELTTSLDIWTSTIFFVTYDGTLYQCNSFIFSNLPFCGNLALIDSSLTDTGEPFAFGVFGIDLVVFALDNNEHTISVKLSDNAEAIDVKIPEKYLPDLGVGIKGTGENAEVFNGGNPEQASGEYAHAEGFETYAEEYAHAEGYMTHAVHTSHAEGRETVTNSSYAHAEGYQTQAQSLSSHAEGSNTTASGEGSHAEGMHTITSSQAAHAEGFGTKASGASSHAEGSSTKAYGNRSHAEGEYTQAGAYEKNGTEKGKGSHAEGYYTKAFSDYQHVQGKFNISDIEEKYAHIVGNGESDSSRSNAHTLDWDGNGWFAGTIEGTALILKSTDDTKRFKVTVDNSGTLTATEIA